jgi:hypothetical protein
MFCTNIETLRKYLPTVIHSEYAKYESEVREANRWMQSEITGDALWEVITAESFDDLKLTQLCESVVARKAYLEGIPSYDLTETSGGFVVTRNENQAPASPERVRKLQEATEKRLTDAIESLVQYLEQNENYHTPWKGSPTYALMTDIYTHTLTQFRRYAPWPGSRLQWVAARPGMLAVIRLKIEPMISRELSEEIIEQLRDDDLSQPNKDILENLRFAFASYVTGQDEAGKSFLYRIRRVLFTRPADFPAWETSELYSAILASGVNKYDPERPFFRAGF